MVDFDGDFITSVYFLNEKIGFASGYDGGIYKTSNAAKQWEVLTGSNNLWKKRVHLNDILMLNNDKGIVVGNNGVIFLTYDAGNSWQKLNIHEELDCFSIYHLGNGELMISCSEGKIIRMNI